MMLNKNKYKNKIIGAFSNLLDRAFWLSLKFRKKGCSLETNKQHVCFFLCYINYDKIYFPSFEFHIINQNLFYLIWFYSAV